ncbi:MAG TPA: hypothetical protein PK264_17820, partial [Hyphomicrobiaceae bacterium]|nr:hypothetical protein [Hyphomicrobiaceae bacterium]
PPKGRSAATAAVVPPAVAAPGAGPDAERAATFKSRGDKSMKVGGIAEARSFYERAAELGSADAAFMLAQTYDPRELKRLGAVGTAADIALARTWYERAAALGHRDGAARAARLNVR